jgi:hypothetical protein
VLDGGLAALQEILLQRLETFGGERRRRLEPVGVVLRRGRAVGLRVSPRDETIGCHWLVWAGTSAALRATLSEAGPPPSSRARSSLRLSGYRYALSLLVSPQALPAGTPARLLVLGDPSRPLLEDNALAVTAGRPGPRDGERIPLWVECVVPAHLVDAGPSYLRALRGRLVQMLDRLWPGFGKQLLLAASPYDGLGVELGGVGAGTGAKTGGTTGATTGATSSVAARPPAIYARAVTGPLDVMGLPHVTGVKNLLLCGRENLPGLDLEGELVSGWGAARLVGHAPVRRVTLRRRTLLGG